MAKGSTANRSETFGRLLSGMVSSIASYEGKSTAIVEEELGAAMNVVGKTVQRYKAGYLPPNDQAVRLLAEAGVQRGFLGREWLQRFLHAARYPFADRLLDELCPAPQVRPRPPRVYENLPAPTYSQFVMRQQAFAEVVDGLQQRSAAVLIVGMGGNGKTSLAREVAARCLHNDNETPRFDAVVWVSDKDRPGTTNLSLVLDEVARTLDYPGFTQFEHDEKRREVEQLLRRQRVLLVVDNFETISDGVLLTWLLCLPEPSKALLTSREKHRGLWSSWLVELRGMMEAEAWELITERAQVLKIERLVGERAQLEPLLAATGGNPKALTMTLGLLKYERRSLQDLVDDLYAARGDLFDDLFTRAWALLDEAARRILLVATFFPATASGDALQATADVQGFAFERAVERLSDLALLDVQQEALNWKPRYALHPLVRALARAKLIEQTPFELGARERWVKWYVALAGQVGECWNDLSKLEIMDSEHETLFSVLMWASKHQLDNETLQLVKDGGYFFYVRGLWDKCSLADLLHFEAANRLSDHVEEIAALANLIQILSRQGNIPEATKYLNKMQDIATSTQIPADIFYEYHHAIDLYWAEQNDIEQSLEALRKSLNRSEELSPYFYIANQQWFATRLHQKGESVEARLVFEAVLSDAIQHKYERGIVAIQIGLASIDLEEGDIENAAAALAASIEIAYRYTDRKYIAESKRVYARLHALRGDIPAARASLAEAIDLFERMGMRRDLAEARQALADLNAGAAAGDAAART
ncbi:MAG: hypothetical protein HGA45_06715 [Chloroflexales bacterium]|nr:hypothetical protein [Chloroflexales bacterium]